MNTWYEASYSADGLYCQTGKIHQKNPEYYDGIYQELLLIKRFTFLFPSTQQKQKT